MDLSCWAAQCGWKLRNLFPLLLPVILVQGSYSAVVKYDAVADVLLFIADVGQADEATVSTPAPNQVVIRLTGGDRFTLSDDATEKSGFDLSLDRCTLTIDALRSPLAALKFQLGDETDLLRVSLTSPLDTLSTLTVDGGPGNDCVIFESSLHVGDALKVTAESIVVDGRIDSSGWEAGEHGGEVQLFGENILLTDRAAIDVSGWAGGGRVELGIDQGGNPDGGGIVLASMKPNRSTVYMEAGAAIDADAVRHGDGGTVILFADRTRMAGSITARGGSDGGDGGFVELSGDALDYPGSVDTKAPMGSAGTLLLDPLDVIFFGGTGDGSDVDFGLGRNANLDDGTIEFDNFPTTNPFIIFESEIEGESVDTNIIVRAGRSISASQNGGAASTILLAPNRSLTLETRNSVTDGAGGIDLTGTSFCPVDVCGAVQTNQDVGFQVQGTGGITINSSPGGGSPADIRLGRLSAASGNILAFAIAGSVIAAGAISKTGGAGIVGLSSLDDIDLTSSGTITTSGAAVSIQGGVNDPTDRITIEADITTNGGIFAAQSRQFVVVNDGNTISTGGEDLEIVSDEIDLNGTNPSEPAVDAGAGDIYIYRRTSGSVGLGQSPGQLQLNQGEINQINGGSLTIGDPDNGIPGDDLGGHINQMNAISMTDVDFTDNGVADQGIAGLVRLFALNGDADITMSGNNVAASIGATASDRILVNDPADADPALLSESGPIDFISLANAAPPGIDIEGRVQSATTMNAEADEVSLDANITAPGGISGNAAVVDVQSASNSAQIADALDLAAEGALITVGDGNYSGSVRVEKIGLTLMGGPGATINPSLLPTNPAIIISASGVTVDGFSYSGSLTEPALLVNGAADNIVIRNGVITGTSVLGSGIQVDTTSLTNIGITIENVSMDAVAGHGITFDRSLSGADIDILDSEIRGELDGIRFASRVTGATRIDISGNVISGGNGAGDRGIEFAADITGNAIVRMLGLNSLFCGDDGVAVLGGLASNALIEIEGNLIPNASVVGEEATDIGAAIDIASVIGTAGVRIIDNELGGADVAVRIDGQITTTSSAQSGYALLMEGNTLNGRDRFGLEFGGDVSGARVGIIRNQRINSVVDPAIDGVHFSGPINQGAVVDILDTTVAIVATDHGVYFGGAVSDATVTISGNPIFANTFSDAVGAGILFDATVSNAHIQIGEVISGATISNVIEVNPNAQGGSNNNHDGVRFAGELLGDSVVVFEGNQIGFAISDPAPLAPKRVPGDGVDFSGGILDTASVQFGDFNRFLAEDRAISVNHLESPSTLAVTAGQYDGNSAALSVVNTLTPGTDGRLEIGGAEFIGGSVSTLLLVLGDIGAAGIDLEFTGPAIFTGGNVGVQLHGPGVEIVENAISDLTFTGQIEHYIQLLSGALFAPGNPNTITASNMNFDGLNPALPVEAAQIEAKIQHFPDNPLVGLIDIVIVPTPTPTSTSTSTRTPTATSTSTASSTPTPTTTSSPTVSATPSFGPTATPTATRTSTSTPTITATTTDQNYDVFPAGGDGQIDARDLLVLLGEEPHPSWFDFSRFWHE